MIYQKCEHIVEVHCTLFHVLRIFINLSETKSVFSDLIQYILNISLDLVCYFISYLYCKTAVTRRMPSACDFGRYSENYRPVLVHILLLLIR